MTLVRAMDLVSPPPPELAMHVCGSIAVADDLPTRYTEADTGRAWRVGRYWYVWSGEWYSIYRATT